MHSLQIKPLTINKAWRGGRRYRTNEYKAYEELLFYLLPKLEIPEGELKLTLVVGFSNKGMDIDNVLKPFIDCLQKKYEFNDNRIYEINIKKKIVKKGEEYIKFNLKQL